MRDLIDRACKLAVEEIAMGHQTMILLPCWEEWLTEVCKFGVPPQGVWVRYTTRQNELFGLRVDTLIHVDPLNTDTDSRGVHRAVESLRISDNPKMIRVSRDTPNEIQKGSEIWHRDPQRIGPLLKKLHELWVQHPDLRLGQLISNLSGGTDIFYIEDKQIMCALENQE